MLLVDPTEINIEVQPVDPVAYSKPLLQFLIKFNPNSHMAHENIFFWRTALAAKSTLTTARVHAVLDQQGVVHGCIFGMPVRALLNGQLFDMIWPVDFFVSPDMRGRGIGKKLLFSLLDHNSHVIGMGGTEMSLGLFRSLHMPIFSVIKSYTRILRPLGYLLRAEDSFRRRLRKISPVAATIARDRIFPWRSSIKITFEFLDHFTSELESLVVEDPPPDTFLLLKEQERVRWLCDPILPGRIQIVALREGGELSGFLILKVLRDDSGLVTGKILDCFCRNFRVDLFTELIRFTLRYFAEQGVHVVRLLASHESLKRACRDLGFLEASGPSLIYMSKLEHIPKEVVWHITMIESDYSFRLR